MRLLGTGTHLACGALLLGWCAVAWLLGAPGWLVAGCYALWMLLEVPNDRWARGFWTVTIVAAATIVWALADGRSGWLALAIAGAWRGLLGVTAVLAYFPAGLGERAGARWPRGVGLRLRQHARIDADA